MRTQVIRRTLQLSFFLLAASFSLGCDEDGEMGPGFEGSVTNIRVDDSDWTAVAAYDAQENQTEWTGTAEMSGYVVPTAEPGDALRVSYTFRSPLTLMRAAGAVFVGIEGQNPNLGGFAADLMETIDLRGDWPISVEGTIRGYGTSGNINRFAGEMVFAPTVGQRLSGLTVTMTVPESMGGGVEMVDGFGPMPDLSAYWIVIEDGDTSGSSPPVQPE